MISLANPRRIVAVAEREAKLIGQPVNIAVVNGDRNVVAHVPVDWASASSPIAARTALFASSALLEQQAASCIRSTILCLQRFLDASVLLHQATKHVPPDFSLGPRSAAVCAWCIGRLMKTARLLRGIQATSPALSSLEHAFANLRDEVTPARGARLRIFVQGKSRALRPAIRGELFLIGREAVLNALRHSEATRIEVEIQYLRKLLSISVRDNGCGISPEAVQKARGALRGLCGMRERAKNIGAQFGIWTRRSAGTEVRVAVPVDVVMAPA
jgi:hypothetical protein